MTTNFQYGFQRAQKVSSVMFIYEEIIGDHVVGDGKQEEGEQKALCSYVFPGHTSGSSKTDGMTGPNSLLHLFN